MLARYRLSSPDAAIRLDAVRDMEQILDEDNVQIFQQRVAVETDSKVKEEIATGLALAALDGSDPQARLAAVTTLRHSLRQDVLNKLQALFVRISRRLVCRERCKCQAGRRVRGEIHWQAAHLLFRF